MGISGKMMFQLIKRILRGIHSQCRKTTVCKSHRGYLCPKVLAKAFFSFLFFTPPPHVSQIRKSYCNSVPLLVLRESCGWIHSLGQLSPESIRFDPLDSLEPQVHISKGLGSTLPPSWAINSMETRLSVWPTFRKDLENRDGVDLGSHVVLSISMGFAAGWLRRPDGRQPSTAAIPGDASTRFLIEGHFKACLDSEAAGSLYPGGKPLDGSIRLAVRGG